MSGTSPVKVLKRMRIITLVLSLLGVGLCGYSIYVSFKKHADKDYKALCDIDAHISCSKVFVSKWGKGFGLLGGVFGEESPLVVSNGVYGTIFYSLVIALGELTTVTAAKVQRGIVLVTNVMSVYLAYILFFVLKDICVVCIATYIINFLLAVCCIVRVNYLGSLRNKKKNSNKSSANAVKSSSPSNKNTSSNTNKISTSNKNPTSNKSSSNPNKNPSSNKNSSNAIKNPSSNKSSKKKTN